MYYIHAHMYVYIFVKFYRKTERRKKYSSQYLCRRCFLCTDFIKLKLKYY